MNKLPSLKISLQGGARRTDCIVE